MLAASRLTTSGNASAPTSPHAFPLLTSLPIPLLPSSSVTSPVAPLSAPNSPNSRTNPPPMQLRTSSPHHVLSLSHLTDERTRGRTRENAKPPHPPAPFAGKLTTLPMNVRPTPSPLTLSALPPPLCSSNSPSPQIPPNCSTPQRVLPPPQSLTWTTFAPCVDMWAISVPTAHET